MLLIDRLSSGNCASLTEIDLSQSAVDVEAFHTLCDVLAQLPRLRALRAEYNDLPREGEAWCMCVGLHYTPSTAGLSIAKVIRSGEGLESLEMCGNTLGDAGVAGISGAFLWQT
jgi:hypothetical protein